MLNCFSAVRFRPKSSSPFGLVVIHSLHALQDHTTSPPQRSSRSTAGGHHRGELPRSEEPPLRHGLSATRIGDPGRRDRELLISAIAIALHTILGASGEAIGIDRYLKANTVKPRIILLLNRVSCTTAPLQR
ncbi:hypothetical protein Anae109_3283 [Anaeromyxobacter sp. Fw109-5]|nr:hypothetical protein Anae109_3283 [Anaeromyxobacter sp. Fw109-5]